MRYGLGSHFYSAPEQIKYARDADHRSDIFSLGKIVQELVRYQSVMDFLTAVEHAVEAPATK